MHRPSIALASLLCLAGCGSGPSNPDGATGGDAAMADGALGDASPGDGAVIDAAGADSALADAAMGACTTGRADCDHVTFNGCEVDLQTDPMNCGACGHVCRFPHGSGACMNGNCTALAGCDTGYANCDDDSNGCEANVQSDAMNCGACGTVCPGIHGTGTCVSGTCADPTCSTGWDDCDGSPLNGCETRLDTSENCGACGHACSGGQTCQNGACR